MFLSFQSRFALCLALIVIVSIGVLLLSAQFFIYYNDCDCTVLYIISIAMCANSASLADSRCCGLGTIATASTSAKVNIESFFHSLMAFCLVKFSHLSMISWQYNGSISMP